MKIWNRPSNMSCTLMHWIAMCSRMMTRCSSMREFTIWMIARQSHKKQRKYLFRIFWLIRIFWFYIVQIINSKKGIPRMSMRESENFWCNQKISDCNGFSDSVSDDYFTLNTYTIWRHVKIVYILKFAHTAGLPSNPRKRQFTIIRAIIVDDN